MEKEVWKAIQGYENLYEVSNYGQVRRKSDGYVMKHHINNKGYPTVRLTKNKRGRNYRVHRLVAIAFIPNPRNVECVNHIDECKTNNCVWNLEWVTYKENNNHGTFNQRVSEGLRKRHRLFRNSNSIPVRCVETREWFCSIREASEKHSIPYATISKCVRGLIETAGGYHWEKASPKENAIVYRQWEKRKAEVIA